MRPPAQAHSQESSREGKKKNGQKEVHILPRRTAALCTSCWNKLGSAHFKSHTETNYPQMCRPVLAIRVSLRLSSEPLCQFLAAPGISIRATPFNLRSSRGWWLNLPDFLFLYPFCFSLSPSNRDKIRPQDKSPRLHIQWGCRVLSKTRCSGGGLRWSLERSKPLAKGC